jgi:hypothetical protein
VPPIANDREEWRKKSVTKDYSEVDSDLRHKNIIRMDRPAVRNLSIAAAATVSCC